MGTTQRNGEAPAGGSAQVVCGAEVTHDSWHFSPCGSKAKVQRGNAWYCGRHDPERADRVAARERKAAKRLADLVAVPVTREQLEALMRELAEMDAKRSAATAAWEALKLQLQERPARLVEAETILRDLATATCKRVSNCMIAFPDAMCGPCRARHYLKRNK